MSVSGIAAARAALRAGEGACLWLRLVADTETPVGAWLKLAQPARGDWLLESVEGGRTRGRYSLLGLDPDRLFKVEGRRVSVNDRWPDAGGWREAGDDPLTALRAEVAAIRMVVPAELPKALAFFVGYMGYETVGMVERLAVPAADPLGLPDMLFVRPRLLLLFDRLSDALFIVAPLFAGAGEGAVAAAVERVEAAAARLAQPIPMAARVEAVEAGVTPALPDGAYAAMVARAKAYIGAGDIFQVVLAQRFSRAFTLPPFDLYRALRRINPSPFLYHLDLPGFALTGSSPEILVRARDGEVTIRPIAGTRPRGVDEAEDAARRAELLQDPKELAEHLMLLDLGRNDVGRVARAGSVRVTESFAVELYSHVMHIVSNVVGAQRADRDAIDALLAGFPAGTVSGAPKVRAMEIIAELEPEKRGAYAGGVGYFGPDGGMDSCIVLRTAVVKDEVMHIQAGAGIVADSDAAAEQRECEAKAGALLAAAREAVRAAGEGRYGQ
ncbi:anthranilate synthase component I family protein [Sandaracinobacteroides saxicola]|uniref:Anthranilate synthase component 1 n=1 Tax=Sandaracinobacteroides saxicola TaxID=2759707 RepID=A0A7G5IJW5_9SPHN|nr:chorismate-binding protein [Sandaracinobacteroides saxicola]QMW23657.1 chorismate-binding protein [Sandaracinobacteroides saxicola]